MQFTSGADTFTVGGNITGAGTINLLDGDDQLTLLDAADLSGLATSLEGGAGNDTLTANVATTATLGGVTGFETLTKHGAGSLHVDGPAGSMFDTVLVQGGVLDVAAGGNVSGVAATTVASGATLHVDGNYAGSAGSDTFTLAGTVSGGGNISLGAGDDVLTLQDGAVLNTVIDAGGQVSGDTIVLDNASALTLAASDVTGFEELVKQNTGIATMTGAQSFSAGTTLDGGRLDVDGTLETPTVALADGTALNVDGTVQAVGATQAVITGSTGVNTVTVSAGATLLATGDLGDGNDVLDVAGTLDAAGGSFLLGAGDDSLVIHDGTDIVATVDGGAGFDTRVYNINLTSDVSALTGFEGLTKTGAGVLNLNGPATSTLAEVAVLSGTLNVAPAGDVAGVQSTQVSAGATLNVDGSLRRQRRQRHLHGGGHGERQRQHQSRRRR